MEGDCAEKMRKSYLVSTVIMFVLNFWGFLMLFALCAFSRTLHLLPVLMSHPDISVALLQFCLCCGFVYIFNKVVRELDPLVLAIDTTSRKFMILFSLLCVRIHFQSAAEALIGVVFLGVFAAVYAPNFAEHKTKEGKSMTIRQLDYNIFGF